MTLLGLLPGRYRRREIQNALKLRSHVFPYLRRRALEAELGVPIKEADMWSIHPAIIARLREDAHLLEITAAPG